MGQNIFLIIFLIIILLVGITKMVFEGFSSKLLIALILSVIIVALLLIRPALEKKINKMKDKH